MMPAIAIDECTHSPKKSQFCCHGIYKAKKKKNMCVYCHMLKKIRVGRSEILFFLILFFIIDVGWHLECISTLEE